jgi:nucleotide exchange factor SIL1
MSISTSFIFIFILAIQASVGILGQQTTEDDSNQMVFVSDVEADEASVKILKDESFAVSGEEFVATNEWQTLKKDQAIPAGLHVRLNLQTGEREAKLMENADEPQRAKIVGGKKHKFSKELEDALKSLNDDSVLPSEDPEAIKIKNVNFR